MDDEGNANTSSGHHADEATETRPGSVFPPTEPPPPSDILTASLASMESNLGFISTADSPINFASVAPENLSNNPFEPFNNSSKRTSSLQVNDAPSLDGMWRQPGGPPGTNLTKPSSNVEVEDDDDENEEIDYDNYMKKSANIIDNITADLSGFQQHILKLNPMLDATNKFLVNRIAHQQIRRYKQLLKNKVVHMGQGANCASGSLCIATGGSAIILAQGKHSQEPDLNLTPPEEVDSTSIEGYVTHQSFPPDIPMPPTIRLPAEFECQLCYQCKKFQKPSDWTKHVHEDVQPFTCTWDKCREPKTFKRKADWVRHENEAHRHLEWWICNVEGCYHKSYRRDSFLQHLVREHKYQEPKTKTKAALKRVERADSTWQKVEECHMETTTRPQDEPCRFCGKQFLTWKKLTVHLAKHMEQISLPVLRLVAAKAKELYENTDISPVQTLPRRHVIPIPQSPLVAVQSFLDHDQSFGHQETRSDDLFRLGPYPIDTWMNNRQEISQNQTVTPWMGRFTGTGGQGTEGFSNFATNFEVGVPTDSGFTPMKSRHGQSQNPFAINAGQEESSFIEWEFNDTATEYFNESRCLTIEMEAYYIREFGEDLFNKISESRPSEEDLERMSTILPNLLKAFALRIGHNAPSQMHLDVMVFVYKHRSAITASFQAQTIQQPESSLDAAIYNSERMPLEDVMGSWFAKQDREEIRIEESGGSYLNNEDTRSVTSRNVVDEELDECSNQKAQEDGKPTHYNFRDFALKSQELQWLLASLQVELHLAPTGPRVVETIRHTIMHWLRPSREVSSNMASEAFQCTFRINWDPLDFLKKQEYTVEPAEAVSRVITLTGSCQDALALTCAQYLSQTWPFTGEITMQLIEDVLRSGPNSPQTGTYPDGTKLCAWINEPDFVMTVSGIAASIAEVGEQLAWLGAALRASPLERGPVHCIPLIGNLYDTYNLSHGLETTYNINFTTEEAVPQTFDSANGQCWHNMFMNPVIVKGYPIPPKREPDSGVEIPLNIMAGLARTQHVDCFKEKTFLKGFSTLLVPTKRSGDTLFWHLLFNEDGSRISYLDNTVAHTEYVGNLDLSKLRHVLGWCSEAKFFAGSAEGNYLVGNSGLPKPYNSCALANLHVSPGRSIVGGTAFGLGTKDTPTHVARNGYIPKLQWIATKFVLLWDESDKRGWLVNGTSALLYLVRASLELNTRDKFRAAFVFKKEYLHESSMPFTADSAIDVLINPENLALKLYHEKDGFLLLQSRIEYFYSILEKLIDHQADVAGVDGINMANKPRRDLEGWDFKDLTTNRDPLYPRVAALEASGKGWVDFTRAIHAVTLFGRGFGELIKPVSADICDYWAELPKEKYYLAACLSDLLQMRENNDYYNDGHVRLSENTIWHTPGVIFGSCQCKGALGPDHCEPVQALFPSSMLTMLLPRKVPIPQESQGAVIFGHSLTFSWVWGDHGQPEAGILSPSKVSDVGSFNDSGLGPSQTSLGSEHSTAISPLNTPELTRAANTNEFDGILIDSPFSGSEEIHDREDYTVGILCALPKELLAVRTLFDRKHNCLDNDPVDSNHYALGQMKRHMVVAACLPAGEYGTNSAADSASNMRRSFPNIRFCLLVGIGGGAPSEENDIRLGDVVVSLPRANHSGVIQYDRGKENENSTFEMTGALQPPPRFLMTAISALTSNPDLPSNPLGPYLSEIVERMRYPRRLKYKHPGQEHDEFFRIACSACQERTSCVGRDIHLQKRSRRPTDDPEIHYGLIASGNRVIKDANVRDEWARKHGVLCFEMEAAGIMNTFPCLVIRGICDYADSYKNKVWQEYAAATAAAYAKLLLGEVAPFESHYGFPSLRRSQTPKDEAYGGPSRSTKRQRVWSDL